MNKQLIAATLALSGAAAPALAVELEANAGIVSEYVFRGIPSSDGKAAAQGGLDATWEQGFYLGTWGSSVDFDGSDGIEVDFYGGWGNEIGDFSYSVGYTLYTYTDDADDDYAEFNLGGAWKWFSVDYAKGEYDNFGGPEVDYDFWSVTAEYEGLYATFGSLGDDLFDGVDSDYIEVGYGSSVQDLFDFTISYIDSDDGLLIGSDSNSRLIFGITKSFAVAE
ncbi:MAG: hypothetical protein HKN56_08910 [Gammaproteobacteria bacterium]|nr:hypothetical protein [Gammaproteobacteria bacterium]